jgi:hypothetical protein
LDNLWTIWHNITGLFNYMDIIANGHLFMHRTRTYTTDLHMYVLVCTVGIRVAYK